MNLTKVKVRRVCVDVFMDLSTIKTKEDFDIARNLIAKVIGLIALKFTQNKTGFKSDCKTIFADYNKRLGIITVKKLI